jgi:hypothetical protein
MLPGRYYLPQHPVYYRQLEIFQSLFPSPFLDLEKEFIGQDGEYIRIFSVNQDRVNAAC